MLTSLREKINTFWGENKSELFTAGIVFLVGFSSFGLGRLSVIWPKKEPITITDEEDLKFPNKKLDFQSESKPVIPKSAASATGSIGIKGKFVASRSSTYFHYPWCPGAQRIKEENKIWFQTKEEAESRGYKPASNCEGL